MPEHLLFLTGRLARPRLERVLAAMAPDFTYDIRDVGVKVAALMTERMIRRRVAPTAGVDRVMLPGRYRGELAGLAEHFGAPVVRGPDDVRDLPEHFGRARRAVDLSGQDVRIFAEIVDAPTRSIDEILARAAAYRTDGADVIDLGCLPDTPFAHLEEAVAALVAHGFVVSVDSADPDELRRGAEAGAAFVLSLSEETLDLADEIAAVPILIPAVHGDLDSLIRAMDAMDRRGRPYLADPVLDPIHFGLTESICRYAELRRRRPDAQILMGTGNLTELTDADTTGVTAVMLGIVSELRIGNVLVVQVSPHCRRVIAETDMARRIMFAARAEGSLPQGIDPALLALRDRKPFAASPAEIAEAARAITDANYRVEVAADGIHLYNRDGHHVAAEPFGLYPAIDVGTDVGHAFYLGVETARAQVAAQLGKRYVQDEPLRWGVAVERAAEDLTTRPADGPTLRERAR